MYSPSPKSEVHLSTITHYMDISSNLIHQQNTWDVPFLSNISCSPSLNHLQSMDVILLVWVPYRAGIFQGRSYEGHVRFFFDRFVLRILSCKTTVRKDSFYPRTIKEWNTLPNCTVSALSPESLKAHLRH
jgi:hypothetical protein